MGSHANCEPDKQQTEFSVTSLSWFFFIAHLLFYLCNWTYFISVSKAKQDQERMYIYTCCTLIVGTSLSWFWWKVKTFKTFRWLTLELCSLGLAVRKSLLRSRKSVIVGSFTFTYYCKYLPCVKPQCMLYFDCIIACIRGLVHVHTHQHRRFICKQNRQIAHSLCQQANLCMAPWRGTDPSTPCSCVCVCVCVQLCACMCCSLLPSSCPHV